MTLPIDIYARVSRVGGREGDSYLSPALQEERCRAMIAATGAEVGEVFLDEDFTGRKMSRPGFDRAMGRVRNGESGGICVWKLSRFGRSTRGVLDGVRELEQHGGILMSTSESLDTSSPMGRFVLTIFAALTELESDQIRESWEATHTSMISRGIPSGPRAPAGYSKGEDKRLVPNEHASHVQEAFRMRAEDGSSWRQIARYLTEHGVPTVTGRPWAPNSARSVLRNRAYLGEVRYGDKVKIGAHAALVDERAFRLANRRQQSGTGPPSGFLLGGGLVRCHVDGSGMVRGLGTSRGRHYEFLRCRHGGSGDHPTISFSRIEPYVRGEFIERVYVRRTPAPAELLNPALDKLVVQEANAELLQHLENVHLEIRELDRLLEDGELPASIYAKAMSVAQRDKESLEAEIAASPPGHPRWVVEADELRYLALNALGSSDEPVPPKLVRAARQLLREVLGTITIHPGRAPVDRRVIFSIPRT